MSSEFHNRWTSKYHSLHKMCILSPPSLPKGILTPEKITKYNRDFAPFYKVWGSKWLWYPALPLLFILVSLQRFLITFRAWKDIGLLIEIYAQTYPSWLKFLSAPAAVAHLLLRTFFLPKTFCLTFGGFSDMKRFGGGVLINLHFPNTTEGIDFCSLSVEGP